MEIHELIDIQFIFLKHTNDQIFFFNTHNTYNLNTSENS